MYITRYCDYMCVNKFIQYSQINEQVKNLDNTFVHFRNSRLGVKGKRKGRQKTVMRYTVVSETDIKKYVDCFEFINTKKPTY